MKQLVKTLDFFFVGHDKPRALRPCRRGKGERALQALEAHGSVSLAEVSLYLMGAVGYSVLCVTSSEPMGFGRFQLEG